MKYYSSNNYASINDASSKEDIDKYTKFNYNIYLKTIKDLENKYDFFSEKGEKIKFNEILEKGIKTIVNIRDNQYNNIFKPLCGRIETKESNLEINTNCFLPKESQSLLIRNNSKF